MSFTVRSTLNTAEATAKMRAGGLRAVKLGAEELLGRSKNQVPHDKGILENSGAVDSDDTNKDAPVASVFYDTPYAVRLHEHPEYNFKGKGRGKWLETAKNESGAEILNFMAKQMREAMK